MGTITKKNISGLSREEWLELRKQSIGGSEIASIVGLNPYASAYSLWCERTGRTPAFEGNLMTRIGTALEDTVARLFEETSGIRVQKTNFIWYNSDFPHMHASPDRLAVSGKTGLEIKTTSAFNAGQFRGEEFPAQYYAQSVQYMAILEYTQWFIAVLIGNHSLKIYQLVRDESIPRPEWVDGRLLVEDGELAALRDVAADFWLHLTNDTPPAVDGSDATAETLEEVFPANDAAEPVELFGRDGLITEWFDIAAQSKALDERKKEIRNILCADLGASELGYCGEHKVTWKEQTRNTFDAKAAVKDHPELSVYYKPSVSRTFTIK